MIIQIRKTSIVDSIGKFIKKRKKEIGIKTTFAVFDLKILNADELVVIQLFMVYCLWYILSDKFICVLSRAEIWGMRKKIGYLFTK